MKSILFASLFALTISCTEFNLGYQSDPSLPGSCRIGEEVEQTFDAFEQSDMLDILFVVDASGDATNMLTLVEEALPNFLQSFEEAGIHVQIGFARSSKNSRLEAGENCSEDIEILDSEEESDWKEIAACNALQEITEDAADEPLSVALDLQDSRLWRDRSKRLVVMISKDDDCSGANVGSDKPRENCNGADKSPLDIFHEGFLENIKSKEGFTLAVIAGPSSSDNERPVCNSTIGSIYAANRLNALVKQLGDRAISQNLCVDDLSFAFGNISEKILESGTTLCANKKMEHEPTRVVDGEDRILKVGKEGFIYEADQNACENGAIVFDHGGSRALEEVKVSYCSL